MPRHRPDSMLTAEELKKREYMRAYQAAHKEHLYALHRTYYEIHKDHLLELARVEYANNPVPKREYAKKYRVANKEYLKGWWREHKTGCSPERYAELSAAQNGVCAICGGVDTRELCADHDHATGVIRGLLCGNCNTGIGKLRHDVKILRAAIEYVSQ